MIQTDQQLTELLPQLAPVDRIAVDTEADSLHCYYEKLCLVQLSFGGNDYLIDPLASFDLAPLANALTNKEIVLQGADFDLRLLRRSMNFVATRIFDTVIAARLLGIREFSLAALVEKFFGTVLTKGSQKANWAQRPLPRHMAEYAMNDTRYLLPLAEKLEADLRERGRYEWFQQSCQRQLEQTSVQRCLKHLSSLECARSWMAMGHTFWPYWGGWGRTSNLPVNSRALCQLSYTPKMGTHDP